MAEFYPRIPDEIWPEGATRPSNEPELAFRKHLEIALADKPWIVVQNLLVQDDNRVGSREIDFLVIDPQRGMIVIEVKGGDYRFDAENGWHRRVRDEIRPDNKGAPKQAIGAMYALVRSLASSALHSAKNPPYLHSWLVVLVDADVEQATLPTDAQWHLVDARGCRNAAGLLANLEDLFESARAQFEHVVCGEESCVGQLAARHILPSMRTRLGVRSEIANARVIETDVLRPLRSIMDAVHGIDRLMVDGYPGTGKTYAALYRARCDLGAGRRTLVLCFNIPLAAALTARLGAMPVRANTPLSAVRACDCVVARFHALATAALTETGTSLLFEAPDYYERLVEAFAHAAASGAFGEFDSIVVDEGQDFSPAMMRALDALSARGCAKGSQRIAFFADPNQSLYDSTPEAELQARFGQPLHLRENLRNSKSIAAFLRELDPTRLRGLESPPSMREGQRVVVWEYAHGDNAAQRDAMASIVRDLHEREDVRLDDIVLLSPFRRERTALHELTTVAGFPLVSLEEAAGRDAAQPPCVRYETLHRFKGLESPAVILHDVAGDGPNVFYEAILTAASRAQHALYVLRSSNYAGGARLAVQGSLP